MAEKLKRISTVKENSVNFTARDLFDRIINLRFTVISGNEEKHFAIRSDYEPVFTRNGSVYFKTCSYKPSIKVEFNGVSSTVGIKILVTVSNLFIQGLGYDDGGNKVITDLNYFSSNNTIKKIEIQMGYRAQFPSWERMGLLGNPKSALEAFYELDNTYVLHTQKTDEAQKANTIIANCLASYITGFPPEREYVFDCVVGNIDNGLDYNKNSKAIYSDSSLVNKNMSPIEVILTNCISRRFVRDSKDFEKRVHEVFYTMKGSKEVELQGVELMNATGGEITRTSHTIKIGEMDSATQKYEWKKLEVGKDGLLSEEDAKKYGVQITLSDKVRGVTLGKDASAGGLKVYTSLSMQLQSLLDTFDWLRFLYKKDGSIFFYHKNERDLWQDKAYEYSVKGKYVLLPAIYDFEPKGLRTIKAPYISWVGPGDIVVFSSRYGKGTFLSHFYRVDTNIFSVILSKVKFSTTDDENEMELNCVDVNSEAVKEDVKRWLFGDNEPQEAEVEEVKVENTPVPETKPVEAEDSAAATVKFLEYDFIQVKVRIGIDPSDREGDYLFSNRAWDNLLKLYAVQSLSFGVSLSAEGSNFSKNNKIKAIRRILEWNPEYTTGGGKWSNRKNGQDFTDNYKSCIGGQAEVDLCPLEKGDFVILKLPFYRDESYYTQGKEYPNPEFKLSTADEFLKGIKNKTVQFSIFNQEARS